MGCKHSHLWTLVCFVLWYFGGISQIDTAQSLPEFVYRDSIQEIHNPYNIGQQEIDQSSDFQVHEVLQKMPGINIRDYGGYGGIKTYAAKGLGAQHSGVVINGVPQSLTFGGVVDLSKIALENIASLQVGQNVSRIVPQSALSFRSANVLFIENQNNQFSDHRYRLKTRLEYGSFDHYLGAVQGHYQVNNRYQVGVTGKYVNVSGDYPFQYQLGETTVNRYRKHAALDMMQFQLTQVIRISRNQTLKIDGGYLERHQELPGAIVLYQNGISQQTLGLQEGNYRLDYWLRKGTFTGRVLVNGNHSFTKYVDSSFFNQNGFLEQNYGHHVVHASVPLHWVLGQFKIYGAVDYRWQKLEGVAYTNTNILRNEIPVVAGAKWQQKGWFADASLLAQWIQSEGSWIQGYNPSVKVGKKWGWIATNVQYKNSLRLPTFYEQYYGKFNETQVLPEKAHQFNLNLSLDNRFAYATWPSVAFSFNLLLNGFYNIVDDKIVTHPTQDLFIWAVENYGKVHTYGGSISGVLSARSTALKVEVDANYTLQYALDKTDPGTTQYNNQIPYTPHNLINAGFLVQWKGLFLNIDYHYNGFRYAWKENNWSNVLEDFYTLDASIGYQHQFQNQHQLTLKVSGKNITDQQYEIIRSYPMPGAYLKIGLSYEIL